MQLKQAINEDIATLKNLDLDIMESTDYYYLHFKQFKSIFFKMYLTLIAAMLILVLINVLSICGSQN